MTRGNNNKITTKKQLAFKLMLVMSEKTISHEMGYCVHLASDLSSDLLFGN